MAYRKRIKICKGIKLNLSGSGVSVTFGGRGASVNVGKKGTYLNTSIPGTGFYNRQKIGGSSNKSSHSGSTSSHRNSTHTRNVSTSIPSGSYTIKLDENYRPVISRDGIQITDQLEYNRTLHNYEINQQVAQLKTSKTKELAEEYNEQIYAQVQLSRYVEPVFTRDDILKKIKSLQPEKYVKKSFGVLPPKPNDIMSALSDQAEKNIPSGIFTKRKRQQFIDEHYDEYMQNAMDKWNSMKQDFEKSEEETEADINQYYQHLYEEEIRRWQLALSDDTDYIEQAIENCLSGIEIPFDFTVDYEYYPAKHMVYLNIDLPEIEDMPDSKAYPDIITMPYRVTTGITYQRHYYIDCVCGIALLFASLIFNLSVSIERILVSGYTQRQSRSNAPVKDNYVYSIIFDREKFSKLEIRPDKAEFDCQKFECHMDVDRTVNKSGTSAKFGLMKTISPFLPENVE